MAIPRPIDGASVEYIRYYARRPMDKDGLWSSSKPFIDGLVRAGLFTDDSDEYMKRSCVQVKVSTVKEEETVIIIDWSEI